jgi:putative resolvase
MSKYYPLRKTIKKLNLHPNTLRRYADENKIKSIRNVGGQRLYAVDDFLRSKGSSYTVCYCRVSSSKQRDDLLRQIEKLKQIYPKAEVIQDIGSGLNFKRKGMYSLLERLMQGDKLKVVVSHRDRLARFGYDIFKFLVERNGGEIVVLDNYVSTSREAELTADLMAILHHFSCRMHGARSHSRKKDSDLSNKRSG